MNFNGPEHELEQGTVLFISANLSWTRIRLLCQLRLNNGKFSFGKQCNQVLSVYDKCSICRDVLDRNEDVFHFLFECKRYELCRARYLRDISREVCSG